MAFGQKQITQRIAFEGGAEIKAQLDQIAAAGGRAFDGLRTAAERTRGVGDNLSREMTTLDSKLKQVGAQASATGQQLVQSFRNGASVNPTLQKMSDLQLAGARVGASLRNVGNEFTQFGRNILALDTPIGRFMTSLRNIALIAAGIGVAKGLSNFLRSAGEGATETEQFAKSVGLTVDEYTKLRSAAKQAGIEEESFRRGLAKINEEFVQAGREGAETSQMFKDIGKAGQDTGEVVVSAFGNFRRGTQTATQVFDDFANKFRSATDEIVVIGGGHIREFGEGTINAANAVKFLADRISSIQDPAKRAALVVQLLGARQSQWTGFLEKGSAGVAALTKNTAAFNTGAAARVAVLAEMNRAFIKLSGTSKKLKEEFIVLFAPQITAAATKFSDVISQNWDKIIAATKPLADVIGQTIDTIFKKLNSDPGAAVAIFEKIATTLTEIAKAAVIVAGLISLAFNAVVAVLNPVADALNFITNIINEKFGTALPRVTGLTLAWVAEIIALVGGFGLFASAVNVATQAVKLLFAVFTKNPFVALGIIIGAFVAFLLVKFGPGLWEGIKTAWQDGVNFLSGLWETLKSGASAVGQWIKDAFNGAVDFVVSIYNGLRDKILGVFNSIIDKAKAVASAVASAFGGGGEQFGPPKPEGFAGGGKVRGPGTGTSDSILARLSNGEFVVRAAAVRKYGTGLFHAFNQMRLPAAPAFNMGGLVEGLTASLLPLPAFAMGGEVPAMAAVGKPAIINIPGVGPMKATVQEDELSRIGKLATRAVIRSAGRKPSWFQG